MKEAFEQDPPLNHSLKSLRETCGTEKTIFQLAWERLLKKSIVVQEENGLVRYNDKREKSVQKEDDRVSNKRQRDVDDDKSKGSIEKLNIDDCDDQKEKKMKKEKKEKKEKKDKKEKKEKKGDIVDREEDYQDDAASETVCQRLQLWENGDKIWREGTLEQSYLDTNPDRITRLFIGNLKKEITEEVMNETFPGIKYIKWIVDAQSKEFYGTTYVEMKDPRAAIAAVKMDRQKLLGRPLKIYYCPPKPGQQWPPQQGKGQGNNGVKPNRQATPQPPGGKKLFIGNLSYEIEDETIIEFFKESGTLIGLRWMSDVKTDKFRGFGYVEFETAEQAAKGRALDGTMCLGRPIRIDWTE